ncbi:MAG: hypothetical protein V4609_04895 [Pseudomonadota bacterium]
MSSSPSCTLAAPPPSDPLFAAWLAELHRLAVAEEIGWVVDRSGATHREAYDTGATPLQEMVNLRDMAQWRGCGCGAGG